MTRVTLNFQLKSSCNPLALSFVSDWIKLRNIQSLMFRIKHLFNSTFIFPVGTISSRQISQVRLVKQNSDYLILTFIIKDQCHVADLILCCSLFCEVLTVFIYGRLWEYFIFLTVHQLWEESEITSFPIQPIFNVMTQEGSAKSVKTRV